MEDLGDVWSDPGSRPWRALSARMTRFVDGLAGRDDLLTVVTPQPTDVGAGHAAVYVPRRAQVIIDATQVLEVGVDNPDAIDPKSAQDRDRWPALVGAAAHAAAHVAHTRLEFGPADSPEAVRWAGALEEVRVEAQLVSDVPRCRRWLRGGFAQVAAAAVQGPSEFEQAVGGLVAVAGRVAAAVFQRQEVVGLVEACGEIVGPDAARVVEQTVGQAVALADGDQHGLLVLGETLAEVVAGLEGDEPDESVGSDDPVDEAAEEDETADEGEDQESAEGDAGDDTAGEMDDRGDESDAPDGDAGGSGGNAAGTDTAGGDGAEDDGTGADQGPADGSNVVAAQMGCGSWTFGELTTDVVESAPPPADVAAQFELLADRIEEEPDEYAPDAGDRQISGGGAAGGEFGGVAKPVPAGRIRVRAVDAELHDQSRWLVSELRRARYRGTQRTEVRSPTPPGRLRPAELMQQSAQIAMGLRPRATPWTQTRRRMVEKPRLVVGISADVSVSMQVAQAETARVTYALQQAVRLLGGSVASVAWDQSVHVVAQPGEWSPVVREVRCQGTSEGCPESLKALDRALGLTRAASGTVRIVVVVTDGALPNFPAINAEVNRLAAAGVRVLWVAPVYGAASLARVASTLSFDDTADFGRALGSRIAELLEQA